MGLSIPRFTHLDAVDRLRVGRVRTGLVRGVVIDAVEDNMFHLRGLPI